jgi:hypothetical protein
MIVLISTKSTLGSTIFMNITIATPTPPLIIIIFMLLALMLMLMLVFRKAKGNRS